MAFPAGLPIGNYYSLDGNLTSINSVASSNKSDCDAKEVFSLKSPFSSDCGYSGIMMSFCQSNSEGLDRLAGQTYANIQRFAWRLFRKRGKQNIQYDYLNGVKIHVRG